MLGLGFQEKLLDQFLVAQALYKLAIIRGLFRFRCFAVNHQMHVHIDKARHQVAALKVDHFVISQGKLVCRRNATKVTVFHRNDKPFLRLHVFAAIQ